MLNDLCNNQKFCLLPAIVTNQLLTIGDLVAVSLYVRDMRHYTAINSEYLKLFRGSNPPVRICVEAPLPPSTPILLEVLGYRTAPQQGDDQSIPSCTRRTMHVQGVSHWAPANIGPYSQAVRVRIIWTVYICQTLQTVDWLGWLFSTKAKLGI